jgi:hypothetical protein
MHEASRASAMGDNIQTTGKLMYIKEIIQIAGNNVRKGGNL